MKTPPELALAKHLLMAGRHNTSTIQKQHAPGAQD
jgi:hypothetical protein